MQLHGKHRQLLDKLEALLDLQEGQFRDRKLITGLACKNKIAADTLKKIQLLEEKIRMMRRNKSFEAATIFATFETEEEQRK